MSLPGIPDKMSFFLGGGSIFDHIPSQKTNMTGKSTMNNESMYFNLLKMGIFQ